MSDFTIYMKGKYKVVVNWVRKFKDNTLGKIDFYKKIRSNFSDVKYYTRRAVSLRNEISGVIYLLKKNETYYTKYQIDNVRILESKYPEDFDNTLFGLSQSMKITYLRFTPRYRKAKKEFDILDTKMIEFEEIRMTVFEEQKKFYSEKYGKAITNYIDDIKLSGVLALKSVNKMRQEDGIVPIKIYDIRGEIGFNEVKLKTMNVELKKKVQNFNIWNKKIAMQTNQNLIYQDSKPSEIYAKKEWGDMESYNKKVNSYAERIDLLKIIDENVRK